MKKTLYEFCMENHKESLLLEWDQKANGEMTPATVTHGSGKMAWWRCSKGHTWQAVINSRSSGSGCPVCAGKTVYNGDNDLMTELPELARQWHPTRNAPLMPSQVTRGSHRQVWWRCEKGHEWRTSVKARAEGNGCPVCAGRRLLSGDNDLAAVYPDLAAQWHPVKNGALTPDMVLSSAMCRVWWRCEKGHEWQARVRERSRGTGCPVCSGQKVEAGVNDLASCYPEIAAQWHPVRNGKKKAHEAAVSSNSRVWWQCGLGHEWQANICSRTMEQTGCPYCTNRKVLAGFNDLATLEPEIARQWHPTLNGSLTPEQVTAGSGRKVWWSCPEGHVWKTVVYARTREKRTGCPVCAGNVRQKASRLEKHDYDRNRDDRQQRGEHDGPCQLVRRQPMLPGTHQRQIPAGNRKQQGGCAQQKRICDKQP